MSEKNLGRLDTQIHRKDNLIKGILSYLEHCRRQYGGTRSERHRTGP